MKAHDHFEGVAILAGAGLPAWSRFSSTALLMRAGSPAKPEVKGFDPFAIYCALAPKRRLACMVVAAIEVQKRASSCLMPRLGEGQVTVR